MTASDLGASHLPVTKECDTTGVPARGKKFESSSVSQNAVDESGIKDLMALIDYVSAELGSYLCKKKYEHDWSH